MSTRRVVITGASSGIGQATARLFAQHGWKVVGVARRADRLAALEAETGISTFVADVTKQEDVDSLRDFLADSGPVHALVNNAGGAFGASSVEDSDPEDSDAVAAWPARADGSMMALERSMLCLPRLSDRATIMRAMAAPPDIVRVAGEAEEAVDIRTTQKVDGRARWNAVADWKATPARSRRAS